MSNLWVLLFLFLAINIQGQELLCEDFENVDSNCPGGLSGNPFFYGCVDDWISTHGRPTISTDNPYNGMNSVRLYVIFDGFNCIESPDRSAGIALDYNFVAGNTYAISYAIRGRADETLWILTSDLANQTGGGVGCPPIDALPDIPANSSTVHNQGFFEDEGWTTYQSNEFTPNSNHDQLWIRPRNYGAHPTAQETSFVYLDNVCIELICDKNNNGVDFFFAHENTPNTPDDVFSICEDVYLNASATNPQTGFYHMSLATDGPGGTLNQLSQTSWWAEGDISWLNVTDIFENNPDNPITFQTGIPYRVELDVYDPGCKEWLVNFLYFEYIDGIPCKEMVDSTACGDEDNYGYIHLECDASGDLSYNWSFPSGSTAIEVTSGNTSTVLNADEGLYSVTITSTDGCTDIRTYNIVSDCCNSVCEIPTGLGCKTGFEIVRLQWSEVADANGYEVEITPNSADCNCPGTPGTPLVYVIPDNTNFFTYISANNSCFSWVVRTICADGSLSEDSAPLCYFAPFGCFSPQLQDGREEDGDVKSRARIDVKPRIYPNPASRDVNIELNTPESLTISVEVYSLEGKLVKSFKKETLPDGIYKKNWSVEEQLGNGLYYIFFKTNFGTFREKIVISKDNHIQR